MAKSKVTAKSTVKSEKKAKSSTVKKTTKKSLSLKSVKKVGKRFTRKPNLSNPISRYLAGAVREIRKVTWPGRAETWKLTLGVVIFSVSFAIFMSLADYGLDRIFEEVILGGN